MELQPQFSIIMPLYNVEEYLNEAIDSVINQTIGFEDNVQLILVNDGSFDHTGIIAKNYAARYSSNVIYISQENGGISSARNAGLEYASGLYVEFFDGDDVLSLDVFEKVHKMFSEHDEIDIIDVRKMRFTLDIEKDVEEVTTGDDWIYDSNRVIDIVETPNQILGANPSTFYRLNTIDFIRYNINVAIAEDLLFTYKVLRNKKKFGIVSDSCYYYRRRNDKSNVTIVLSDDLATQSAMLESVFLWIFQDSINRFGSILEYIQYQACKRLYLRLRAWRGGKLGQLDSSEAEYLAYFRKVLSSINDDILCSSIWINKKHRITLLCMKYGIPTGNGVSIVEGQMLCCGIPIQKQASEKIKMQEIRISRDKLYLSFQYSTIDFNSQNEFYLQTNGGVPIRIADIPTFETTVQKNTVCFLDYEIAYNNEIIVQGFIDISDIKSVAVRLYVNGSDSQKATKFNYAAKFRTKKTRFYRSGKYLLTFNSQQREVVINKKSPLRVFNNERKYIADSIKTEKDKMLALSLLWAIIGKKKTPDNCLIFDFDAIEDNEELQRYTQENPDLKYHKFRTAQEIREFIKSHPKKYIQMVINAKYIFSNNEPKDDNLLMREYTKYFERFFDFTWIVFSKAYKDKMRIL